MTLHAECPRCPAGVVEHDGAWVCPMHGRTAPLWRPATPDYDTLVQHLEKAGGMPSWAPWPVPSGWALSDFGAVRPDGPHASASFVTCGGMTGSDGVVRLTAVTEEAGTGLGARIAGSVHDDPGAQTLGRPVQTRVRAGGTTVPLWLLPATDERTDDPLDRAVLVGELRGRWLWLVVSPASAALGLGTWGPLEDLGQRGPGLVELEFTSRAADW